MKPGLRDSTGHCKAGGMDFAFNRTRQLVLRNLKIVVGHEREGHEFQRLRKKSRM